MRDIARATVPAATMVLVLAVSPPAAAQGDAQGDAELMRPTERGLRLTPSLARALSRSWLFETSQREVTLNDEQEAAMTEAMARRMMQLAHANGEKGQQFLEYMIEAMITGEGKVTPEMSREFGQRWAPLAPVADGLLEGVGQDARRNLPADAAEQLEKNLSEQRKMLDALDARMKRWAEGQVEERESPFEDLESELGGGKDTEEKRNPALENAERFANWQLEQIGPAQWAAFLAGVKYFFKFDEQQSARGRELLEDYRRQAKVVMTDDWNRRVRRNRVQLNLLGWHMRDQPVRPWRHHLERKYEETIKPIKELGRAFRAKVLALATDEQREAALGEVREKAQEHGMTAEEADAGLFLRVYE